MTKYNKLTGLYIKKSKDGNQYLAGKGFVVQKNKFKKDEKHPDWFLYKLEQENMPVVEESDEFEL